MDARIRFKLNDRHFNEFKLRFPVTMSELNVKNLRETLKQIQLRAQVNLGRNLTHGEMAEIAGVGLTLPRFHVHQKFDKLKVYGGNYGTRFISNTPAVHIGIQG